MFYTIAERIDVDNTSDGELVEKHWDEGLKKVSSVFNESLPRQKDLTQWISIVFG